MNCQDAKSGLAALLDGSVGGGEARRLREHFAACADCAQSLDPAERLEFLPVLDETVEPSAGLQERFRARLRAHRAEQSGPGWWALLWRPRQLAALGAFIAVFVAVIYFGVDRPAQPVPDQEVAEIAIAENLPLLQELGIITNLDLLEDFDAIRDMNENAGPPSEIH